MLKTCLMRFSPAFAWESEGVFHVKHFDVLVVGGGHAGCEAAHAAARMGVKTGLIITAAINASSFVLAGILNWILIFFRVGA